MGKKIIKEYGLLFIISVVLNIWSVAITDKNYPEKIDDGQKFALFFVFLFLNLVNIYYTNKLKTIKEKKLAKIGMVVGLLLTLGIASIKSIEFVMLLIAGLILQGGIGGYIWYIMENEEEKEEKGSMVEDEGGGENMVLVEGGEFMMGSNNGSDNEKPVHKVYLNSFYISKYEITQKEWVEIMGSNPSCYWGYDYPVENVNWYDVQKYIKKLNKKTGKKYRLPTEAEWEFAAKGGNLNQGYIYAGSNYLNAVAWYKNNHIDLDIVARNKSIYNNYINTNKTNTVGTKEPNELGLYDMSGNVWEWCQDWYSEDYYNNSPSNDPKGPEKGEYRVMRGGAWSEIDKHCRSTYRGYGNPYGNISKVGFRLAADM